jgi:hypothetical protein
VAIPGEIDEGEVDGGLVLRGRSVSRRRDGFGSTNVDAASRREPSRENGDERSAKKRTHNKSFGRSVPTIRLTPPPGEKFRGGRNLRSGRGIRHSPVPDPKSEYEKRATE